MHPEHLESTPILYESVSIDIVRSFPDVTAMVMATDMANPTTLRLNCHTLCCDVGLMRLWGWHGGLGMLCACSTMQAKIQSMGLAIASYSVGSWYWVVLKMFIK